MKSVATILLTALLAVAATAAPPRQLIGTTQDHSIADATDCEHFHTSTFTSFPARVQEQEQLEVPLAGIDLLKVRASREGGVSIRGWDRPTARLLVCKYAVAHTRKQARQALDGINVSYRNGDISALGPEIDNAQVWWVNMILFVPKSATVDVASANGGIAIRNMSGRITAHATNGGISMAHCGGENRVTTENGGISLEKISGRLDATTQNGPIAYKLRDTSLPALEAHTDSDGEILCNLKRCDEATWTANRKSLRLGSAVPSIRLSTAGAPIMIEQVR
jgi:hypothetical protein